MAGRILPVPGVSRVPPAYANFFENIVTVQFGHRVLALATFFFLGYLWLRARREPLPPGTRLAYNWLLAAAALQVALGVATLLLYVPVPLAAAHQGGALLLFAVALWALHGVARRQEGERAYCRVQLRSAGPPREIRRRTWRLEMRLAGKICR